MVKKHKIKKIAVLTSGGDGPGMNAAIRSVVRYAHYYGIKTYGVLRGYAGLVDNEMVEMGLRSVSNIIQHGGTILKTSRCKEFETKAGLSRAVRNLDENGIEGLITIGGDGTYRGAYDLTKVWRGQVVGAPGTIDNDLYGTDETIGYDTAVNTALEAIDKIRDTADSHERFFLIEVMGRHAGFIAIEVGIGGGAEEVLIPETKSDLSRLSRRLIEGKRKGKTSSIVIVAEGEEEGNAFQIAEKLKKVCQIESRVVVLGHVQRGGNPTARDRSLATELGAYAVEALRNGKTGVCVGKIGGMLKTTPLKTAFSKKKKPNSFLLKLIPILSN